MYSALTIIRSGFLDLDEVFLGVLVPQPTEPAVDFWPSKPPVFEPNDVHCREIKHIYQLLSTNKYASLSAKITSYFSSKAGAESSSNIELVASTCKLHYLRQPLIYFNDLCADGDARQWIEETCKHYPIFLITGLLTVTDATLNHSRTGATEAEAGVTVPISTAPPVDAEIQFQVRRQASAAASFLAEGERVIGVQYRKVKTRRFFVEEGDKHSLAKNRWVMFLGDHEGRSVVDGSRPILEAELEEAIQLDDFEFGESEFDVHIEDDEFVFLEERE
jgi:hypothetical protein